jgi:hypothetical protein
MISTKALAIVHQRMRMFLSYHARIKLTPLIRRIKWTPRPRLNVILSEVTRSFPAASAEQVAILALFVICEASPISVRGIGIYEAAEAGYSSLYAPLQPGAVSGLGFQPGFGVQPGFQGNSIGLAPANQPPNPGDVQDAQQYLQDILDSDNEISEMTSMRLQAPSAQSKLLQLVTKIRMGISCVSATMPTGL